jgi:hypothetical protein
MLSWRERFDEIDLLVQAIPDVLAPGSWRTPREAETQRLVDQLYDECPADERDALGAAHEEWYDRKQREGDDKLASFCVENGLTLFAATDPDRLEELAGAFEKAGGHSNAWGLRRAAQARRAPTRAPRLVTPCASRHVRPARPRERRERHVARATSSADSGDDGPSDDEGPLARLRRAIRRARRWRA